MGSGTPAQAQIESRRRATQDIAASIAGGRIRGLATRAQATQLRFEGQRRRERGLLTAAQAFGNIGTSLGTLAGSL